MRKRMRYYQKPCRPPWWLKIRTICAQILVPLICFQFIRTILLPTAFDLFLLTIMVVLYCSIWFKLW
ncbi:hypothetical protein [Alkalihalobacillus sp. 1P02AB]|uniref:hypothetical protein n=1 Tax=Alkalihalobacillus sp. 1P02AB TaxID=3132260 RepID=UPI0039A76491